MAGYWLLALGLVLFAVVVIGFFALTVLAHPLFPALFVGL